MNPSYFYICAIPDTEWSNHSVLHELAEDANICERRITKQVNLKNEYQRYIRICRSIQKEILLSDKMRMVKELREFKKAGSTGFYPTQVLVPGYLSVLSGLLSLQSDSRMGANHFCPADLKHHLAVFDRSCRQLNCEALPAVEQRLQFIRWAVEMNYGIVEIQTTFHYAANEGALPKIQTGQSSNPNHNWQTLTRDIDFNKINPERETLFYGNKELAERKLRTNIINALREDSPISFGNTAPHDVFTEVLNQLVFASQQELSQPANLRVIYVDGSEAETFPLFVLQRISTSLPDQDKLQVGLMSMRHLEMDRDVDISWFRNREVSQIRILAETDDFCYRRTFEQLEEIGKSFSGPLVIRLFHTGFEPAVVGFYRGLTRFLLEEEKQGNRPRFAVIPMYFRGKDGYLSGKVWQ